MADKEAKLTIKLKDEATKQAKKVSDAIKAIGATSAVAFAGVAIAVNKAIDSYREQELATRQLTQAMVQQGVFTGDLIDRYLEMASSLQQVTTFGDEQIIQAQSLLQSFIGQKEITEGLMRATLDLAAAKNIDLKTAAELVGKTIGSENNVLARQGVLFDNNTEGAARLAAVVEALNGKFGGQAEAAAKGLGSLERMKNAFSDLWEELGARFAPAVEVVAEKLTTLFNFIRDNQAIIGFVAAIVAAAGAVAGIAAATSGFILLVASLKTALVTLGIGMAAVTGPIGIIAASLAAVGVGFGVWLMNSKKAILTADELTGAIERQKQKVKELTDELEERNKRRSLFGASAKAALKKELDEELALLQDYQNQLKTIEEKSAAEKEQRDAETAERKREKIAEDLYKDKEVEMATKEALFQEEMADEEQKAMTKIAADIATKDKQIANANTHQEKLRLLGEKAVLVDQMHAIQRKNNEEKINEMRLQGYSTFFGGLAALSESNNKTISAIGKAAAITQATINAYVAIQNALASVPYPANIAAAAGIGIQAFANVARIAGVQLAEGGIVMPRPGGTQATIGEAGQAEAVIPLDRASEFGLGGGQGMVINFNGPIMGDESQARRFAEVLDRELYKMRKENNSLSFEGII